MFVSPPFCTGYAWHAWRAERSWPALVGLIVAALELTAMVVLMVGGLFAS